MVFSKASVTMFCVWNIHDLRGKILQSYMQNNIDTLIFAKVSTPQAVQLTSLLLC